LRAARGMGGESRYTRQHMAAEVSPPPDQPLSETEYANRLLPQRESPFEVGVTLLAAGAICLGVYALIFTPFKPGFLAIALAVLANAFSAGNSRLPRIALVVAVLGWLIGGVLAVLTDAPVW
jgi:hypothetical protein